LGWVGEKQAATEAKAKADPYGMTTRKANATATANATVTVTAKTTIAAAKV
jgi:hypothetical protein